MNLQLRLVPTLKLSIPKRFYRQTNWKSPGIKSMKNEYEYIQDLSKNYLSYKSYHK